MTTMPNRLAGASLPETPIYWLEDGVYLNLTGYTCQIEAVNTATPATVLWTKTTGITPAAGTATTPNLTVAWTDLDLGALPAGTYRLEVTATLGGRSRKHQLVQTIDPQI